MNIYKQNPSHPTFHRHLLLQVPTPVIIVIKACCRPSMQERRRREYLYYKHTIPYTPAHPLLVLYLSSSNNGQRAPKTNKVNCYQFQSSSSSKLVAVAVPLLVGASELSVLPTDVDVEAVESLSAGAEAEVGASTDGIITLPAFTVSSSSSSNQLPGRGAGI